MHSDYDVRSLQHERRMLELYRKSAGSDGGMLQPLANACWRAASFEWQLHQDAAAVRTLWEEASRALAEGFVRKRAGFPQSAGQLILALHFSVAAQNLDVVKTLIYVTPSSASHSRSARFTRTSMLLLSAYQSIVRALLEGKTEYAQAAQRDLAEAWMEPDRHERQVLSPGVTAWSLAELEATGGLLSTMAKVLALRPHFQQDEFDSEAATVGFESLMDSALLSLDQRVESEVDHLPKLYCWLPGVALTNLAKSAGMPMDWLESRHQSNQRGYSRLPLQLVYLTENLRARASSNHL